MAKFHITFDTESFKQVLIRLVSERMAKNEESVLAAMERFEDDCFTKEPTCPLDEGILRDSHQIFTIKHSNSIISGVLLVTTPYAASLHEGISKYGTPYKYHTPGTGSHWIMSKLLSYGNTYLAIASQGMI